MSYLSINNAHSIERALDWGANEMFWDLFFLICALNHLILNMLQLQIHLVCQYIKQYYDTCCFCRFVNSLVYYGLSLSSSSLGGNDYINFLISGAVEIPAYLFCQLTMNRLGRRWTLSGTMILGGIALLLTMAIPKGLHVFDMYLSIFCYGYVIEQGVVIL